MNNNNSTSTKKILLWLLGAGGIAVLSIMAPQLPSVILKSYLKDKYRLRERLKRLEENKWIKITEYGDKIKLELVEDGQLKALYYKLEDLKINKPKQWDGLWRIVIFDIPEEKKIAREVLRNKLKQLGFVQLQKSVFVFPYDCKKEIEIIKNAYEIWPYTNLIVAHEVDAEDKLKDKFSL
jgi:CRISPR-associated endonuclease Cas2